MATLQYRKEIDGLRALAVVPIIFYHAGLNLFSGGFVGVDVFFVISGYLITSIIIAECSNGSFSIFKFYERRARRILPALYFVMAWSIILGYLIMFPDQFKIFSRTIISVLFFSSNFYFLNNINYFSSDIDLNPLLHTWSLAVEEQFYLLFPILFLVIWKLGTRTLVFSILLITLVSLVLAECMLSIWPVSAFYLLPSRIWELGLGALVAIFLFNIKWEPTPKVTEVGAILGLLLILGSVFFYNSGTSFPGLHAIYPTVGAVLLILFANEDNLTGKFLSCRPMVFLGLISYSAYLWHHPLFAYTKIISDTNPTLVTMIELCILTLLLAYLSYRYIETPCRDQNIVSTKSIFTATVSISCILLLSVITTSLPNDNPGRPEWLADNDRNTPYVTRRYFAETHDVFEDNGKPKLLLIGDSFSQDFYNMAREVGAFKKYQVVAQYFDVCCQIYLGDRDISKFIFPKYRKQCSQKRQAKDTVTLAHKADVIVFAFKWEDWAIKLLPETINNYGFRADQQLIVIGRKSFGESGPLSIKKMVMSGVKRVETTEYHQLVTEVSREILPSNIFVDTHAMLCGNGSSCPLFSPEGEILSFDGNHLTPAGAKYLGKLIFNDEKLKPYL